MEEKFPKKSFQTSSETTRRQAFTKRSPKLPQVSGNFPEIFGNFRKFPAVSGKLPETAEGVPKVSETFLPRSAIGAPPLGPRKEVTDLGRPPKVSSPEPPEPAPPAPAPGAARDPKLEDSWEPLLEARVTPLGRLSKCPAGILRPGSW